MISIYKIFNRIISYSLPIASLYISRDKTNYTEENIKGGNKELYIFIFLFAS